MGLYDQQDYFFDKRQINSPKARLNLLALDKKSAM